ncbi:MAG: hypothetical protein ACYSTT_19980 [Planctomycetota bacterium]|jgi:hypothetical protein
MENRDWTEIGGARQTFLTTHWSMLEGIKQHDDKERNLHKATR